MGIDCQPNALLDGTLPTGFAEYQPLGFSLEFHVGDGLEGLRYGECDVICIAGLGVSSMLRILQWGNKQEEEEQKEMDIDLTTSLGCHTLILQPSDAKIRNMMTLYERLYNVGWCVMDERIVEVRG